MDNLSMVDDQEMELPPGFRFHPTDEELITHYLSHKYLDSNFNAIAIGEVDLNKIEPWELPRIAKWGEKEWYFFCVRDRKYPTGLRTNRATEAGYWKATGKDKDIYRAKTLVGMKKTLVFYTGRAPKGEKTNWVMHEYRLEGKLAKYNHPNNNVKNEWVISRVFEKNSSPKKSDNPGSVSPEELYPSCLPPLMDSSPYECETKEIFSPKVTNDVNSSYVTCFSSPRDLIDQEIADLEFVNSILAQDQPMMKLLLDEKGSIKEETPQEIGLNNGSDVNNNYEFILNPSGSNGLDCLWSY